MSKNMPKKNLAIYLILYILLKLDRSIEVMLSLEVTLSF